MRYPYNHRLIGIARNLRKNMTPQERHLWFDFLRLCRPRFRRQEVIGDFIADFYCHDAKLVVEIDGSQHYTPAEREKDNRRTFFFHTLGLKVLRISNSDVTQNFDGVCQAILFAAKQCDCVLSIRDDN